jgi:hypothetical protein
MVVLRESQVNLGILASGRGLKKLFYAVFMGRR